MSKPFVPGWTLTLEAQNATPQQREAAMRDAIRWVERTGRFLIADDEGETLARELHALGRFESLRPEDVRALIELAERLGTAAQTSDERRAKREAGRWVAEQGHLLAPARMREELAHRWPALPADERRQLEQEAAYRRRMRAVEEGNRAAGEAVAWVRSPEADALTLEQLSDELQRRGVDDRVIVRLVEQARVRRQPAPTLTHGLIEREF